MNNPSIYKPLPRDTYGNTVDDYAERIFRKKDELEELRRRKDALLKVMRNAK